MAAALPGVAVRLHALGVLRGIELRRCGSPATHDRVHGLDVAGIAASVRAILDQRG